MAAELLGQKAEETQPENPRLVIELVDGNVKVTGPIHDRGTCYMMLEMGKDAVREHCYRLQIHQQQERQKLAFISQQLEKQKH